MNQLVVAALVGLLVAAPEARNPEDAVKRLMAETPTAARKAQAVEADYNLAIDYLVAGLAGDDVTKWERWDPRLERLCHHAATPGLDVHRLAATKALLAHVKDPKLRKAASASSATSGCSVARRPSGRSLRSSRTRRCARRLAVH